MATQKQRKAVERIVENHGNVSKSMREVGYDDTTAKNPKNLTESKGYKELLKEYGLTEGLIAKSLVEDIEEKKGNRVSELRLGADIIGMIKREAEVSSLTQNNLTINIHDKKALKVAQKFEEELRKTYELGKPINSRLADEKQDSK